MARIFDENALMDNIGGDVGFLVETIQMLETDGPVLMQQIRQALVASDAATVGKAAHALKGMVSNFCSPQAQAAALEVEKLGKSGDLSAAQAAVKTLAERVDTLTRELAEFAKEKQ
jgi:two-component system, sensor histidine kinase and response regulator